MLTLEQLYQRRSQLANFEPLQDVPYADIVKSSRVLIIGAGGIGCEMLKSAPLMGFRQIDIIDMDTIDVSNLNRQFLFRKQDIGKSKAETAAKFIKQRYSHMKDLEIRAHNCRIEDFAVSWYSQFALIMCGLDSIEARRWINRTIHQIYFGSLKRKNEDTEQEDLESDVSMIPLIDGGTEGLKGQIRVILPGMTACYECTLAMNNTERKAFPICTIANTPRLPEHCIEWASVIQWEKESPFGAGVLFDTDNPAHMKWIYDTAAERASVFQIPGVTYQLCMAVLKNIVPAIAGTNAYIGAAVVNEALKIITGVASPLALSTFKEDDMDTSSRFVPDVNDFVLTIGDSIDQGIYSLALRYEQLDDCPVCSEEASKAMLSGTQQPLNLQIDESDYTNGRLKLQDMIDQLRDQIFEVRLVKLKRPSYTAVTADGKSMNLYLSSPSFLEESTRPNLEKAVSELVGASVRSFTVVISDNLTLGNGQFIEIEVTVTN
ncbi:hypothetical protein MP228_006162 [Amoeboaphelidium protococcarum]|nr:hypothetical protein MP228_006162 [Amoeboaphelidium protococcarum]